MWEQGPWPILKGARFEIGVFDEGYPPALREIAQPPDKLYGIGNVSALCEGLAVVGARKATPYGIGCAERFAGIAAKKGITIISGGARGCDSAAHRAALKENAHTVVFLGGGCDRIYPKQNFEMFQEVIEKGGCVVSENPFEFNPLPYTFRARNRLIAGLAKATLIVEAGLPSGTFSTADEALAANKDVLVVPGSITSKQSRGANRLIYQGAIPVVDDETFADQLFSIFGIMKQHSLPENEASKDEPNDLQEGAKLLLDAIKAQPLGIEEIHVLATRYIHVEDVRSWLMVWLIEMQNNNVIAQYPDGKYGPKVVDTKGERLERGILRPCRQQERSGSSEEALQEAKPL